jgi:hypothetical protein
MKSAMQLKSHAQFTGENASLISRKKVNALSLETMKCSMPAMKEKSCDIHIMRQCVASSSIVSGKVQVTHAGEVGT